MMNNFTYLHKEISGLPITICFENDELVFLSLSEDYLDDVKKNFSHQEWIEQVVDQKSQEVFDQLEKYFNHQLTKFSIPCKLKGTPFQLKVWQALTTIEYGEILSYSAVAEKIHQPTAVRAVGSAIGKNPIGLIIPCHRVNGKNQTLNGFRAGLKTKAFLQNLEQNT